MRSVRRKIGRSLPIRAVRYLDRLAAGSLLHPDMIQAVVVVGYIRQQLAIAREPRTADRRRRDEYAFRVRPSLHPFSKLNDGNAKGYECTERDCNGESNHAGAAVHG